MEDHHTNAKRSTDARLEHINVPAGDGYTRWHTISRHRDPNSLRSADDLHVDVPPTQSRLHQTLDLCKRKLFFWR